jgi:RNA polymerase sigma-70 factor (ECF subfamily)
MNFMARGAGTAKAALAAAFLARVAPGWSGEHGAGLEAELEARWAAGKDAWPGVLVDSRAFARYLAERLTSPSLPPVERAADLYLACACAHKDVKAAAALHSLLSDVVPRAASGIDPSKAFLDDVRQTMAEKLLIAQGDEPPRIIEYAGRASLRGWLLTAARRTALNMRRRKDDQPQAEVVSSVGLAAAAGGPEAALLKARYKAEFEAAIRAALSKLSPKDRSLLVAHLVTDATLPQLAATHGVSRATVTRWLAAAREALQRGTERELRERLRVTPSEYESLVALVRSELDVSLSEVLGPDPAV